MKIQRKLHLPRTRQCRRLKITIFPMMYLTADTICLRDISNRRFDIWKSAVEIFKTSPVFGISRANILPYVDDNLPDSYLVTNEYMRFDSMHNMFFEILVSQGAVGLITFLTFIIFVIVGIFKYGKYLWYHKYFPLFTVILSIAASACMSTACYGRDCVCYISHFNYFLDFN